MVRPQIPVPGGTPVVGAGRSVPEDQGQPGRSGGGFFKRKNQMETFGKSVSSSAVIYGKVPPQEQFHRFGRVMVAAFVKLKTVSGHDLFIGVNHIVAIEPLLAEGENRAMIRLDAPSEFFDDPTKRWSAIPQSYVVFGTIEEIVRKIEEAQKKTMEFGLTN